MFLFFSSFVFGICIKLISFCQKRGAEKKEHWFIVLLAGIGIYFKSWLILFNMKFIFYVLIRIFTDAVALQLFVLKQRYCLLVVENFHSFNPKRWTRSKQWTRNTRAHTKSSHRTLSVLLATIVLWKWGEKFVALTFIIFCHSLERVTSKIHKLSLSLSVCVECNKISKW